MMTRNIILRSIFIEPMRIKVIIRYIGIALLLVALMMAVSAIIAVFDGYDDSATPLITSAMVTFVVGFYPLIFVRPERNIKPKEGIAIVVLAWLMCCLFGMIPYICYGDEFTFINSFFESVSGFTTTGASILDEIESLPKGLLFWRVSTSWVGGLGIVSFFSLVIPRSMDKQSVLSNAELSDIARSQTSKSGKAFVKTILSVYVILTAACSVLLKLAGQSWFDAVTNAMSTCSTCGFCVRNASIAAYESAAVELIIIFFMTTCGVSFMLLSTLATGRKSARRRISTTTAAFLLSLLAATAIISLNLHNNLQKGWLESLRLAAFQVSSISTTTGFATADTNLWPALSILLLTVASVICGCSGSTSGGIKMDRIVLIFSYIRNSFRTAADPHRIIGTRISGRIVSEKDATEAMKFVLIYVALIIVGAIVNIIFGLDLKTGVTAAIACIGNVGPGFGSVGSLGNYADFPAVLKFSNSLLMLAGRLEIFPILSFIGLSAERN